MFARVFRGTWASAKQGEGRKYLRLDKLLQHKREKKDSFFSMYIVFKLSFANRCVEFLVAS